MALRRLSMAHTYLRAASCVRAASGTTDNEKNFGEDKPICPGNAFTLFLETQPRDGKSLKKHVYEAACKWNTLSQEEKRSFRLQAKELEKKYHKEISNWEVRMQQRGREDLVQRHRQLTDGKNLAIGNSQEALQDQGQDSMVTLQSKKESPVMEEDTSHVEEEINEPSSLIKTAMEGKEALIKETVQEEREPLTVGLGKEDQSHLKEVIIRSPPAQCSKSTSSAKPFRSKRKQIIIKSRLFS